MGPKHPAAARFVSDGLFEGLTSFAELEQRISTLPEATKVRGDAFEVFAEAYLATQKLAQAEEIWPSAVLPEKLKRDLNLPPVEEGIDGIYLSKSGEYGAYQAKFRTGRPNLTWRELSTFFGVSDIKEAVSYRDGLTERMTPTQIAEAEKLAKAWKPNPKACSNS